MSKSKESNNVNRSGSRAHMEQIANASYISSPYYRTFLNSTGGGSGQSSSTIPYGVTTPSAGGSISKMKAARSPQRTLAAGYRRRKGLIFLILILMLVMTSVIVLGYLGNLFPEYISAFNVEGEEIQHLGITDPVFAFLKKFAKVDSFESIFYTNFMDNAEAQATVLDKAVAYALPIAVALLALFVVITIFAALIALLKKSVRKGYVAKKVRFGILSFILFILSLITLACGIIWNGQGFSEAVPFLTQKAQHISAGYGLLGIAGISFLSLLFSWGAYKKVKK